MKIHANLEAHRLCAQVVSHAENFRIAQSNALNGTTLLDFGVHVHGGIQAGLLLSEICMGGAAKVQLVGENPELWRGPQILVTTDHPVIACMASQYAGWPIQRDDFFAMGSGPMRCRRGKEPILESFQFEEESSFAVGVLECDSLPNELLCDQIANECRVAPDQLTLCVAPTRSIAGTIQVVARSIETSLHKLFELGFDLRCLVSGCGTAPLPPPAKNFADGIGRTNDAILYGGRVQLWIDCDDSAMEEVGAMVPSCTSSDWGMPFGKIFKKYNYDFYQVDPGLFSPAELTIFNLKSGRSWRFGKLRPDVLEESFGTKGP